MGRPWSSQPFSQVECGSPPTHTIFGWGAPLAPPLTADWLQGLSIIQPHPLPPISSKGGDSHPAMPTAPFTTSPPGGLCGRAVVATRTPRGSQHLIFGNLFFPPESLPKAQSPHFFTEPAWNWGFHKTHKIVILVDPYIPDLACQAPDCETPVSSKPRRAEFLSMRKTKLIRFDAFISYWQFCCWKLLSDIWYLGNLVGLTRWLSK